MTRATGGDVDERSGRTSTRARTVTGVIFVATVAQLLLATLAPDLPQFSGKAFGSRLLAYPLMMLLVPAVWAAVRRVRRGTRPLPWTGCALIAAPFLVDVTGNTLDLYDAVTWWDDANHFVNWALLCGGVGLLVLRARITPRWALGCVVAGLGALLAIAWEVAEWYTFIRHGTELDTAYTDTLGDEVLGTLGGTLAAVLVARFGGRPAADTAPAARTVPAADTAPATRSPAG